MTARRVMSPIRRARVFEERRRICDRSRCRRQVYVDGAHLNALVGAPPGGSGPTSPSTCTLRSHPHGGGAPRLSDRRQGALAPTSPSAARRSGPVRRPVSGRVRLRLHRPLVGYIALMGRRCLPLHRRAICSANYLAALLGAHYPVLYTAGRASVRLHRDLRANHEFDRVSVDDVPALMATASRATMASVAARDDRTDESETLAGLPALRSDLASAPEIDRIATDLGRCPLAHCAAPQTAEDLLVGGSGVPRDVAPSLSRCA